MSPTDATTKLALIGFGAIGQALAQQLQGDARLRVTQVHPGRDWRTWHAMCAQRFPEAYPA